MLNLCFSWISHFICSAKIETDTILTLCIQMRKKWEKAEFQIPFAYN